ncbi:MAG: histidine phosphatase family protein [Pseudomonadota bacterium]
MLRLFILRHAKSSWALPGVPDHDRPLNDRGKRNLPLIEKALLDRQYHPKIVICSSSARTIATKDGVQAALDGATITIDSELYHGSPDTYIQTLKATPERKSVMMIGHNPSCDELVRGLCAPTGDVMQNYLSRHFPTSGLAVIDFDADQWCNIKMRSGDLVDFLVPRDL